MPSDMLCSVILGIGLSLGSNGTPTGTGEGVEVIVGRRGVSSLLRGGETTGEELVGGVSDWFTGGVATSVWVVVGGDDSETAAVAVTELALIVALVLEVKIDSTLSVFFCSRCTGGGMGTVAMGNCRVCSCCSWDMSFCRCVKSSLFCIRRCSTRAYVYDGKRDRGEVMT